VHLCGAYKSKYGSVIDDRNFRGPSASVIGAVYAAIEFDHMAGLTNNLKKFVALSTTVEGRQTLQQTKFDGRHINVQQEDILVGMCISTRKAPRRHRQDLRALETIRSATILRTGVGADLKAHAVVVAAIPKFLHGNLWTMPSVAILKRARTACARGQWGKGRATRCLEVLLAVLSNPVRADPVSAIAYRGICDVRRLISKSSARCGKFLTNLGVAEDICLQNIQGPIHGFISLVASIGARISRDDMGILLVSQFSNTSTRLVGGSDTAFRSALKDFATSNILAELQQRVHHVGHADHDVHDEYIEDDPMPPLVGDPYYDPGPLWIEANADTRLTNVASSPPAPAVQNGLASACATGKDDVDSLPSSTWRGRKDMVGITACLNEHATFYATHNSKVKRKKQPVDTPLTIDDYGDGLTPVNQAVWKRHLQTILAGATRFADRLYAARITSSDLCDHPQCGGARCDAEHWHYNCHYNTPVRSKYGTAAGKVIAQINVDTYHGTQRARALTRLLSKTCLRLWTLP